MYVKLNVTADSGGGDYPEDVTYGEVVNASNSKAWVSGYVTVPMDDVQTTTFESYVGVTSGKTYTLGMSADSQTGYGFGAVWIYYSSSINQHAPTVTDY